MYYKQLRDALDPQETVAAFRYFITPSERQNTFIPHDVSANADTYSECRRVQGHVRERAHEGHLPVVGA